MVAAAAAWYGLAAELSSVSRSYEAVISELTGGPWLGYRRTAALHTATTR